jgi:hypothetical protein
VEEEFTDCGGLTEYSDVCKLMKDRRRLVYMRRVVVVRVSLCRERINVFHV